MPEPARDPPKAEDHWYNKIFWMGISGVVAAFVASLITYAVTRFEILTTPINDFVPIRFDAEALLKEKYVNMRFRNAGTLAKKDVFINIEIPNHEQSITITPDRFCAPIENINSASLFWQTFKCPFINLEYSRLFIIHGLPSDIRVRIEYLDFRDWILCSKQPNENSPELAYHCTDDRDAILHDR